MCKVLKVAYILDFQSCLKFDTIEDTLIYAQVPLHLLLVYKETIRINGLELNSKETHFPLTEEWRHIIYKCLEFKLIYSDFHIFSAHSLIDICI